MLSSELLAHPKSNEIEFGVAVSFVKVKIVLLSIVALGSLYAGLASVSEVQLVRLLKKPAPEESKPVTYDGRTFDSASDMEIYIRDHWRDQLFPWAHFLEEWHAIAIIAAAAGFIGGFVRQIIDIVRKVPDPPSSGIGFLVGPMLVLASALYEALMMEGDLQFKPISVAALSALAGAFWENAWSYLEGFAKRKFETT